MKREIAAAMMEAALSIGRDLNKLDSHVSELGSGLEKEELVRALGVIFGVLTQEFVFRIAREHPDLDPDR